MPRKSDRVHQGSSLFLHMEEPFEIQSDYSKTVNDEGARRAHAVYCGCDWPPFDWQNAFEAWLIDIEYGTENEDELRLVIDLQELAERENFARNNLLLVSKLGELYDVMGSSSVATPKHHAFLEAMRGASSVLVQVQSLIIRDLWKDHWLWKPKDGHYRFGKWFAK